MLCEFGKPYAHSRLMATLAVGLGSISFLVSALNISRGHMRCTATGYYGALEKAFFQPLKPLQQARDKKSRDVDQGSRIISDLQILYIVDH